MNDDYAIREAALIEVSDAIIRARLPLAKRTVETESGRENIMIDNGMQRAFDIVQTALDKTRQQRTAAKDE